MCHAWDLFITLLHSTTSAQKLNRMPLKFINFHYFICVRINNNNTIKQNA